MPESGPAGRRWPWLAVLGLAVVATVFAGFQALDLRVETALDRLLPDGQPAADAYRLLLEKFGGSEKIYIVVEGGEGSEGSDDAREQIADAGARLAELLAASGLVESARNGLTASDEAFLLESVLPRSVLLLDQDQLPRLARRLEPEAIRARLRWLKAQLSGPAGPFEAPLHAADPLGIAGDLEGLAIGGELLPVDPWTDAFVSTSGRSGLVVVTPAVAALDSGAGRALMAHIEGAYDIVRKDHGAAFEFHAIGGPLYAVQDERAIRGNMIAIVIGTAIGIALLLVPYFRGVRTPIVLGLTVVAGVLWTAALVATLRGTLSVIGVSFAAILLGLGVDYGIHGATEFRARLIEGIEPGRGMRRTLARVGPAILTSALTTAAVALVLTRARFEPIRDLGFLVAAGIGAILVASVTIGAASLVLLAVAVRHTAAVAQPGWLWRRVRRLVERLAEFGERRRGSVLAVAALLSLVAVFGATRVQFNADLRTLRPVNHPAEAVERKLVEEFAVGMDGFQVIVEGPSLGLALVEADRARRWLEANLPANVTIVAPSDFLVTGELLDRRLESLRGVVRSETLGFLETELRRDGFRSAAFAPGLETLRALAANERPPEIRPEAWPDWLNELLCVEAERTYAVIRVTTREESWSKGPPDEIVNALRVVVPSAAFASVPRLGGELRALVGQEMRRLDSWALLALLLLLLASFRGNVRRAVTSLLPVGVGCLWLLGLCGLLSIRIDIFSIAAGPLLLGIGIDDGLHAVHGERVHGTLARAVRHAGPAMTMTTLTTCVGFGSLAFSSIPALSTGGPLIAAGALLCLLATLVLLPAIGSPALRARQTVVSSRPGAGKPQAPATGLVARLLGPLHVTGVFWFRLHQFGVRILPRWMIGPGIGLFTTAFYFALRRIGYAVGSNLNVVLGPAVGWERRRRVFRTLHTFAWCLTERYENLSVDGDFEVSVENLEAWNAMSGGGQGVIVVTGHIGNWEIGSAFPATREQREVHLVREEELDPRAQEFIRGLLRDRMGERYHTHFAGHDPRLGILLLEALRRGEVVALQGDRPREGGKTVQVELFGRPYRLPEGPMALARLAGASLLPVFMLREGRSRYRIRFAQPIRVAETSRRNDDLREAAQRFARILESTIRENPHQWFCFSPLWKDPE